MELPAENKSKSKKTRKYGGSELYCMWTFPLNDSRLWYPWAAEIPLHVFRCHSMTTKVIYEDTAEHTSSLILSPVLFVAITSKFA